MIRVPLWIMKTKYCIVALILGMLTGAVAMSAQTATKHVLAFYSAGVERDHVVFAEQAVKFFAADAKAHGIEFSSTTDWNDLNATRLRGVQVVLPGLAETRLWDGLGLIHSARTSR